jgi:hypothetical protein
MTKQEIYNKIKDLEYLHVLLNRYYYMEGKVSSFTLMLDIDKLEKELKSE